MLSCLNPDDGPPQRGSRRSLDEEAEAAISFLTSRVERARFGLPLLPRSILIPGRWSGV